MSGTQHCGRSALKLTPNKVPAFTLEDMKTYLQSAPSCSGGPTLSGQPPTIETLEFVGCKELTDRLNLFIGLPDDALVCYVVLRGPFQLTMLSYPPGAVQGYQFLRQSKKFTMRAQVICLYGALAHLLISAEGSKVR